MECSFEDIFFKQKLNELLKLHQIKVILKFFPCSIRKFNFAGMVKKHLRNTCLEGFKQKGTLCETNCHGIKK